jgi:hypothetical protein
MASNRKRSELATEITTLQALQLESWRNATFGGWTREQEIAHQELSERISVLQRELNALDGTPCKYLA